MREEAPKASMSCENSGAPGRIRTCDTGFRRAVLYPLSYEGLSGSQLTGRGRRQRSSAITFVKLSAWCSCTVK